jgi:hypothetical protein
MPDSGYCQVTFCTQKALLNFLSGVRKIVAIQKAGEAGNDSVLRSSFGFLMQIWRLKPELLNRLIKKASLLKGLAHFTYRPRRQYNVRTSDELMTSIAS